jgi:hypothetical protein
MRTMWPHILDIDIVIIFHLFYFWRERSFVINPLQHTGIMLVSPNPDHMDHALHLVMASHRLTSSNAAAPCLLASHRLHIRYHVVHFKYQITENQPVVGWLGGSGTPRFDVSKMEEYSCVGCGVPDDIVVIVVTSSISIPVGSVSWMHFPGCARRGRVCVRE